MMLTNLNSISRYERMRRRVRPVDTYVDELGRSETSETIEDDDGTRGLPVKRRQGEAVRQSLLRRRAVLAPERRRWSRRGAQETREIIGGNVNVWV